MPATEDIQKTPGISLVYDENNNVKTLSVPKTSTEKVLEVIMLALAIINAGIALMEVLLIAADILGSYIWPVPLVHVLLILAIVLYFRSRPPVELEINHYTLSLTKKILNKTTIRLISLDNINYLSRSFTTGKGNFGCDIFAVTHDQKKILLVRKKVSNENEYHALSACVSAFLNVKFSE